MATDDTGKAAGSSGAPSSSTASTSTSTGTQTVAAQRAGLVQALEELSRGERAAAKLEDELRTFEAKLDTLLSSLGMTEADLDDDEDASKEDEEKTHKTAAEDGKT